MAKSPKVDPEADNLRIPSEFTRRHGRDLPEFVFLKVPTSRLWEIEVIKSDYEVLLKKGWEEFRDHYSIKLGHFLTFEYDGKKHFDVSMFDMTCTQIEYPSDDSDKETGSDSDHSVEFLGEFSRKQNTLGNNLAMVCHQEEETIRKRSKIDVGDHTASNEDEEDNFTVQGGSRISTTWRFTKKLMIYHAYSLALPKEFAQGVDISAHGKIRLQNAKGGEWLVNIVGKKAVRDRYALGGRWYKFLLDNKVTIGSTMSFEFVSSSDNIIEARIMKMGTNKKKLFDYVRRSGGGFKMISSHDHARRKPVRVPRVIGVEQ